MRSCPASSPSATVGYWAGLETTTSAFLGWFSLAPTHEDDLTEAELGYRLRRSIWGRGYATGGARAFRLTPGDLQAASTYAGDSDDIWGADDEYALTRADWIRREAAAIPRGNTTTPGHGEPWHPDVLGGSGQTRGGSA
jgi:hypothetical protein